MPVIVAGENFDVLSAKMVLSICSMLHDCNLYNPGADWEVEKCSALRADSPITNIAVCAWGVVDTGTGMVVYNNIDINFFEFVLRVD